MRPSLRTDVSRFVRALLSQHLGVAVSILCLSPTPCAQQPESEVCSGTTFCRSGTFSAGGKAFIDCHFPVDVNKSKASFLLAKQRNCKKDSFSDTVLNCKWTSGGVLSCIADDRTLPPAVVRGSWLRVEKQQVHPGDAGRYFCDLVPPRSEESSEACFLVVTHSASLHTTQPSLPDTTTESILTSSSAMTSPTYGVKSESGSRDHDGDASASFGAFVTLQVVCVIAATTFGVHFFLYKFYSRDMMSVTRAIVAVVLVIQAEWTRSQDIRTVHYTQVSGSDVIFTESLLFEKSARTNVQCSMLCASHAGCSTFTHTADSQSSGTCRGHSTRQSCDSSCTPKANTRYFQESVNLDANQAENCADKQSGSGVRQLIVAGIELHVSAYCDQDTDDGGWTVIQRRRDGSVDFNRTWDEYTAGFGDPAGEYWLGLKTLHSMTSSQSYELRFDLQLYDGTTGFAVYANFTVWPSSAFYKLSLGTKPTMIRGNVYQGLSNSHFYPFSTWDVDHDETASENYASREGGGWWYPQGGGNVFPNSRYSRSSSCRTFLCPRWIEFGTMEEDSLQKVVIMIRPMP